MRVKMYGLPSSVYIVMFTFILLFFADISEFYEVTSEGSVKNHEEERNISNVTNINGSLTVQNLLDILDNQLESVKTILEKEESGGFDIYYNLSKIENELSKIQLKNHSKFLEMKLCFLNATIKYFKYKTLNKIKGPLTADISRYINELATFKEETNTTEVETRINNVTKTISAFKKELSVANKPDDITKIKNQFTTIKKEVDDFMTIYSKTVSPLPQIESLYKKISSIKKDLIADQSIGFNTYDRLSRMEEEVNKLQSNYNSTLLAIEFFYLKETIKYFNYKVINKAKSPIILEMDRYLNELNALKETTSSTDMILEINYVIDMIKKRKKELSDLFKPYDIKDIQRQLTRIENEFENYKSSHSKKRPNFKRIITTNNENFETDHSKPKPKGIFEKIKDFFTSAALSVYNFLRRYIG